MQMESDGDVTTSEQPTFIGTYDATLDDTGDTRSDVTIRDASMQTRSHQPIHQQVFVNVSQVFVTIVSMPRHVDHLLPHVDSMVVDLVQSVYE